MITISKKLNILILEDIPIDAELVRCELEKADISFSMRRVATRNRFIKELNEFMPDVILADYTLPQFTGLEALRHVRECGLDTPYILVTGAQKEEIAVQCLREGADDYIMKSSLKRLPGAWKRCLKKKKQNVKRNAWFKNLKNRRIKCSQFLRALRTLFLRSIVPGG